MASSCENQLARLSASEGVQSIVLLSGSGADTRLTGLSFDSDPLFRGLESFPVHALVYEWSLSELQIQAGGEVASVIPGSGRLLPRPAASYALDPTELVWSELTLEATIPEFYLPDLDLPRCAEEGGCLVEPGDADVACTLPCPEPTQVLQPAQPTIVDDPIERPNPPAPPILTPCPSSWAESSRDGASYCEPPPMVLAECPPDQVELFPGEGCVRLGSECPPGEYADVSALGGPVLYVSAKATISGDGRLVSPFRTLSEAILRAPSAGATIALGKGTYVERVEMTNPVTVVGACVAETKISISGPCCVATIESTGSTTDVKLRSVHVSGWQPLRINGGSFEGEGLLLEGLGPRGWGWITRDGGRSTGRDVWIRGKDAEGIVVESGASFSADGVRVDWSGTGVLVGEGTSLLGGHLFVRALSSAEPLPYGIRTAGLVDLSEVVIDQVDEVAILLESGATASISGLWVRGDSGSSDQTAVRIAAGARATLDRAVIQGTTSAAIELVGPSSLLELQDAVIRGGRQAGLEVVGAEAIVRRTLIESNEGPAIALQSSRLEGSDLVIRDHLSSGSSEAGAGIVARESRVDLRRALLARNEHAGMAILDGSIAVVEDLMVLGSNHGDFGATALDSVMTLERALLDSNSSGLLVDASTVTLAHVLIRGGTTGSMLRLGSRASLRSVGFEGTIAGAIVEGPATRVDFEEVTFVGTDQEPFDQESFNSIAALDSTVNVRGMRSDRGPIRLEAGTIAAIRDTWVRGAYNGIFAEGARSLDLERVRIDGSSSAGVRLINTPVDARDLTVLDSAGIGIELSGPSTLVRALASRNEPIGIFVRGRSEVWLEEITIEDSLASGPSASGSGAGLNLSGESNVAMERFRISRNASTGVNVLAVEGLLEPGRIQFADGAIEDHGVAVLAGREVDFSALMSRVRYARNPRTFVR